MPVADHEADLRRQQIVHDARGLARIDGAGLDLALVAVTSLAQCFGDRRSAKSQLLYIGFR